MGEQDKALEYFAQALLLRRAVGDRAGEAVTLSNMGAVYSALGKQDKALEDYAQALPLRRAVGDLQGESVTRYNIAMAYAALGELDKAEEQLIDVVQIDERVGHPDLASDRAALARLRARRAAKP